MKTVTVRAWWQAKKIGVKVSVDGEASETKTLPRKKALGLIATLRARAKAGKFKLVERPRYEPYQLGDAALFRGDSLVVLQQLADCTVDSVICDPPYHLTSASSSSKGFMGKSWDGGDIAFRVELWKEVLRVTKPGGYLLAFSGSRTFHRMAVAIEDAGWQIKDTCIAYCYGSGFPKSKNISKDIDRRLGKKSTVVGQEDTSYGYQEDRTRRHTTRDITVATTKEAKAWEGYGSALKPAYEPIVVAMKPLEGTYADNALKHGVSGLNIDGGRINVGVTSTGKVPGRTATGVNTKGRWPANLLFCHTPFCRCVGTKKVRSDNAPADHTPTGKDGITKIKKNVKRGGAGHGDADGFEEIKAWECHPSCLVAALDAQGDDMGVHSAGAAKDPDPDQYYRKGRKRKSSRGGAGTFGQIGGAGGRVGDGGGTSRFFQTFEPEVPFFYTAKANGKERTAGGKVKNMHPTLKPLSICRYLCKLTKTPTGGVVLDPFMGSGSMGIAALLEGRQYIGIELERASYKTAIARIEQLPYYKAMAAKEAKARRIKRNKKLWPTRMKTIF